MYIDEFLFSPFAINKNIVTAYNNHFRCEKEKLYIKGKKVSSEIFYNEFTKISGNRERDKILCAEFIRLFGNAKHLIPYELAQFAVYYDYFYNNANPIRYINEKSIRTNKNGKNILLKDL